MPEWLFPFKLMQRRIGSAVTLPKGGLKTLYTALVNFHLAPLGIHMTALPKAFIIPADTLF
jgi:hypothetical protein